jgi:hypothetical protein
VVGGFKTPGGLPHRLITHPEQHQPAQADQPAQYGGADEEKSEKFLCGSATRQIFVHGSFIGNGCEIKTKAS